jgi:hypothetical protein
MKLTEASMANLVVVFIKAEMQVVGLFSCAGLRLSGRPHLRRAYRLRHSEEDRDALTAAAGRQDFRGDAEATIDVLPIVHDPDITCGSYREIRLHLQASANVASGRRNLVTRLHAGRAVFGAHATKLHYGTIRGGKVGNPDVAASVVWPGARRGTIGIKPGQIYPRSSPDQPRD